MAVVVCFRCRGRMRELVRPHRAGAANDDGPPVGHNVRCTECFFERPADTMSALLYASTLQAKAKVPNA